MIEDRRTGRIIQRCWALFEYIKFLSLTYILITTDLFKYNGIT